MVISSVAVHRQTERHKGVEAANKTQLFSDKHHDDAFDNISHYCSMLEM
jgi:hypothetical protein